MSDFFDVQKFYIIRMKGSHCYKIGISENPSSRLSTLQVGCPNTLEMIAVCDCVHAKALEDLVKAQWQDYYVRGEWYVLEGATYLRFSEFIMMAISSQIDAQAQTWAEMSEHMKARVKRSRHMFSAIYEATYT